MESMKVPESLEQGVTAVVNNTGNNLSLVMMTPAIIRYTVKRVDEVVRHRHLVTQDQNTQVSKKIFDIPTENFTINI